MRILVDTETEGARRKEEGDKKLLTFVKEGGRAKINTVSCIIIIIFFPLSSPLCPHISCQSLCSGRLTPWKSNVDKEKIAFDRGEQNRKETPREPPQRSGREGGEPEREKNGQERDSGAGLRKYGC